MSVTKKPGSYRRGRPVGSGGHDDSEALVELARQIAANPSLKVWPTIIRILATADETPVRRVHRKWQKHGAALLEREDACRRQRIETQATYRGGRPRKGIDSNTVRALQLGLMSIAEAGLVPDLAISAVRREMEERALRQFIAPTIDLQVLADREAALRVAEARAYIPGMAETATSIMARAREESLSALTEARRAQEAMLGPATRATEIIQEIREHEERVRETFERATRPLSDAMLVARRRS